MNSQFLFPAILLFISSIGWKALPQRVLRDVVAGEITDEQGQRYCRMYRTWCAALAIIGMIGAALALSGK